MRVFFFSFFFFFFFFFFTFFFHFRDSPLTAAATILVIPRIGIRDEKNLIDNGHRGETIELSVLYDVDFFFEQWALACPNIRVLESDKDIPNLEGGRILAPHRITDLEIVRQTVVDAGSWRNSFETWLKSKFTPERVAAMSPEQPLRVVGKAMLFAWHRESMNQDFAYAFARMFRFKPSLRRLGAAALWGLEQATGRPIVSDHILFPAQTAAALAGAGAGPAPRLWGLGRQPPPLSAASVPPPINTSLVTHLGYRRVRPDSFVGIHLRADSDSVKMKWPGYDAQVPTYLREVVAHNQTDVYLAAGTPAAVTQFKADAEPHGLAIWTKEDVLGPEEMAEYETLTWDKRAVIDFQVLLHASFFAGFGQSTFSQTMALRRAGLPEAGTNQINPWRPFTDASFEIFRDNLSSIICGLHGQTLDMMWP